MFAERIEEELELLDSVRRVELWGVQPEQIYVEVDSADWARLGVTAGQLRELFQARNIVVPGGEINTDQSRYAVNPAGEFTSIEQMSDLIVERVGGTLPVRLGDLPVTIERRYQEPPPAITRLTEPGAPHQFSLVLGISMKSGRNVTEMDALVEATLERLRSSFLPPDVMLTRINDLPRQVSTRIEDFRINLLQGVGIVLGVALLAMGWRVAVIMASAVPLSMIAAFAIARYVGIELEQFSVASLIIALGMVVDNAIVVSDNVFRLMREGVSRVEAAIRGAQDLAIPILTSTLTTIAAFLPMLTMAGNVGEYVSSLPVVVALTLGASYFVGMIVTPIMCAWLLKPAHTTESESTNSRFLERYDRVIVWSLERPGRVLGIAGALFLASLLLLPVIGSQFFPSGSRDQFFVKVWLPEGAGITATSQLVEGIEAELVAASAIQTAEGEVHRLRNVTTFVGTGGPRLMVTQEPEYDYPYFAMLLVNTVDSAYTNDYARDVRQQLSTVVDARVTVNLFMLGPPIQDRSRATRRNETRGVCVHDQDAVDARSRLRSLGARTWSFDAESPRLRLRQRGVARGGRERTLAPPALRTRDSRRGVGLRIGTGNSRSRRLTSPYDKCIYTIWQTGPRGNSTFTPSSRRGRNVRALISARLFARSRSSTTTPSNRRGSWPLSFHSLPPPPNSGAPPSAS